MRIAYFDCYAGISGNMALAAVADAGAGPAAIREALAGLKLSGYRLHFTRFLSRFVRSRAFRSASLRLRFSIFRSGSSRFVSPFPGDRRVMNLLPPNETMNENRSVSVAFLLSRNRLHRAGHPFHGRGKQQGPSHIQSIALCCSKFAASMTGKLCRAKEVIRPASSGLQH